MAKKKKKKGGKQINPHKLGENELIGRIDSHLDQDNTNQAYNLAKVLLEKNDSEQNKDLFKSILERKIKKMEEAGQNREIGILINEAKKRFDAQLFSDADEYNKISRLSNEELIDHFAAKEEIPESFHYRIADHLFFSRKNDKDFIKKHRKFKDLFYVKEAFKNGYQPETTRKLLSGIASKSPFRHWILLRKALEAFYDDDYASLELLNKKIKEKSFPKFLIGKLRDCQELMEGNTDNYTRMSETDIEIFSLLGGRDFFVAGIFNRLSNLLKQGNFQRMHQILDASKKLIDTRYHDDLSILTLGMILGSMGDYFREETYLTKLRNFPNIKTFYLNRDHLKVKFLGLDSISGYDEDYLIANIVKSSALATCRFFKPEILKAELLFRSAETMESPESRFERSRSLLNAVFFDDDDDDPWYRDEQREKTNLLEDSLGLSRHNPKIFTTLIAEYIATNEKTSKINRVVKDLLDSFPDNPDGYKLAGDIAYKNKTYSKALGFYEKAFKLMPLNREFASTIIQCYSDIILKRNKKNAHLIEKDLEKAKRYVNSTNKKAVLEFDLLKARAFLMLARYFPESVEERHAKVGDLFDSFKDDPGCLFKYLLLADASPDRNFRDGHLSMAKDHLIATLNPKDFTAILNHYLFGTDSINVDRSLFFDLLLGFLKNQKRNPSVTADEITVWLLSCLNKDWNGLFMAFCWLGRCVFPQNPVFAFLAETSRQPVRRIVIDESLFHEETIEWFMTDMGHEILDCLYDYSVQFEHIYEIIEEVEDEAIDFDYCREEFEHVLDTLTTPFGRFNTHFYGQRRSVDTTPLDVVKKILGLEKEYPTKETETKKPIKAIEETPQPALRTVSKKVDADPPDTNQQLDFFSLMDN
ncbi:MAG: hypothetical protein GY866_20575 [Proteobacteria bacterium]|nr:hypothetical protein [Pseudomonadota bacterium]